MQDSTDFVWIPDLIGPIFKRKSHSLRKVLIAHRNDKCTRTMATFIPDELIHETDLAKKNFRKFTAVVALINMSNFFSLYKKHESAENGGCFALITLLNKCFSVIIQGVYTGDGDILKFSREGLLVIWKISTGDYIGNMVYNVILCGQRIQDTIASFRDDKSRPKVDIAVSAGELIFSIIGTEESRDFVVAGIPIEELKYARRTSLPGDLVLASSAWEHCAPAQFEYVIKDSNNVKIIKVLVSPDDLSDQKTLVLVQTETRRSIVPFESSADLITISEISELSPLSDEEVVVVHARVSLVDGLKRNLGDFLKPYILKPVLEQINQELSLDYLKEVRCVTVLCVNVIPSNCSVYELISLIDEIFRLLQNIVEEYFGCITTINLYESDILFHILYGVKNYVPDELSYNSSASGILSSAKIFKKLKRLPGVKMVSIGIATGMAFCGVVGHLIRQQYMVFGTPVDKATSLMLASFDKISCDYDTMLLSAMNRKKFRSRGIRTLSKFGKCQVYEFIDISSKFEGSSNFDYSYPILGRSQELECFKDILDNIGVIGRLYAGILIEGAERSGKSRLLDAFVTIVRNRQLKLVQLSLHESYAEKSYAVLYQVFIQLFNAVDCTSSLSRQKVLLSKLAHVLAPGDFCYLNAIMRVQFPLSNELCRSSDWQRHTKTIKIMETILNVVGPVCILLDNVQYMDLLSWQFLSSAINNKDVILVMALLEPISWDNLSQVEAGICQDKRLMHQSLSSLNEKHLVAFACQFLNVIAIPRSLEKILQQNSRNMISWCEAFLMSALQVSALKLITISPPEVASYELVFPECSWVAKIPKDLTPDEVAPPLSWTQMSSLNVCVPSGMPIGFIETNRDVIGLRIDIYNRMNSYEQDFIKCAAILGSIFPRHVIESVLTNSAPLYTAKAVAEMIKLRILECGMIQRKQFHSDDSKYNLYKKRQTFSNMYHLVTCDCQSSRIFAQKTLPSESNCKLLEFTISSYRQFFYEILSDHEKKDYHMKAANILERDAHRCSTCGSNSFLNIISKEVGKPMQEESAKLPTIVTMQGRGTLLGNNGDPRNSKSSKNLTLATRKSIYITDFIAESESRKRENRSLRRISILPIHATDDENNEASGVASETGQARPETIDPTTVKNSSAASEILGKVSWNHRLNDLKYIDYRNCRCMDVVNYLFWQLHYHMTYCNDSKRLAKFMLEYTAALIETAQPLHAIKYLIKYSASTEIARIRAQLFREMPTSYAETGTLLVLTGDAYFACGNFPQAKRFYTEAVELHNFPLKNNKTICYNMVKEKIRHILLGFPDYNLNQIFGALAASNLHLSVYLQRLSRIYMLQNLSKSARLIILHGLRLAFESSGGFLEKGTIYLTAVEIFRHFDDLDLIHPLEEPMVWTITNKMTWNSGEELLLVAKVYRTIYETRLLIGKLNNAIEIGTAILKICNCLSMVMLKLNILPSLIELMLWTKRLHSAVDLLRELFFLSKEDIDYSAMTWYYALSLQFHLDAGMSLETYDTCLEFHNNLSSYSSKSCVLRDPESLSRLTTCLGIWRLRMTIAVTDEYVQDVDVFVKDIKHYNFAQIFNCVKGLECYLLILKRRINIKKSSDLFDRVENANIIIKVLRHLYDISPVVKPAFYLLQAYMNLLRGRRSMCQQYLRKSEKWALDQGNKLIVAWIGQNKRTWQQANINTMAQYWVENANAFNAVKWQEIHNFPVETWSTIMYPLPVPDSNF